MVDRKIPHKMKPERVNALDSVEGHYSPYRTCEMDMLDTTDETYASLVHLVHQLVFG